jgi:WD40 repeat protein
LHANPRIFDEQIYSISSSADSRLITTTSKYGEKKLWNAHTGQEIALVTTRHLASNPVFSRDGTKLATTYNNGIIIWDMPTMKKIQTIQQCNAASIQFTKDNTQLITPITGTNFVTIWDIASGRKITTLNEVTWPKNDPLNSKKLSPDGTLHLQALDESTLQLSNIRAESVIGTVGHKNTHQKIVFTKFSPDSTKLAIVSTLSPRGAILTLTMWDTASGTKKWRFSQSDWIYKTHFSADSQQLLIFDSNKAQLLDCATGRILAVFKHTQNLSSAHFVN